MIDSLEFGVDKLRNEMGDIRGSLQRMEVSRSPCTEEKSPAAAQEEDLKGRRSSTIGNCSDPSSTSWNSPSSLAMVQKNGLTVWGSSLNFKRCRKIRKSNWQPIIKRGRPTNGGNG